MNFLRLYFAAALFLAVLIGNLSASPALAETFNARVVSVVDGDTINVSRSGDFRGPRERVILYGIDCPEPGQDFGSEARAFTDKAVFRKDVSVEVKSKDPHGRLVANVYLADGSSLNEALVRSGLAWWSDKFAPNELMLKQLAATARAEHKGLWSKADPVPPWIFRNGDKNVQAEIKTR